MQLDILASRCTDCREGAIGEPHRNTKTSGKFKHAANVVGMLMRDHDARNLFGHPAETLETGLSFLDAEATIEHDRGTACAAGIGGGNE